MSFYYNNNLKIEFRAVPYSTSHVLEFRISPDQDLNYEVEKSFFFVLNTRKRRSIVLIGINLHDFVIILALIAMMKKIAICQFL